LLEQAVADSSHGEMNSEGPGVEAFLRRTCFCQALLSSPKWLHEQLVGSPVHNNASYAPL
jgi:hypothetical protein